MIGLDVLELNWITEDMEFNLRICMPYFAACKGILQPNKQKWEFVMSFQFDSLLGACMGSWTMRSYAMCHDGHAVQAEQLMIAKNLNKEYLPMQGLDTFRKATVDLLLGSGNKAVTEACPNSQRLLSA